MDTYRIEALLPFRVQKVSRMMEAVENERATARELVSYARQQGVDLEALRNDSMFQRDQRWILLWRKLDGLPCSGPVNEKEGTLHYSMQGTVDRLPGALEEHRVNSQGVWTEAGILDRIEQALELVKAWLLDKKEIADLPNRHVRRHGS
jgi:hypothetical protein